MSDIPTRIPGYDAREWVKLWRETIAAHPDIPTDDGAMLGWFANAIMCGYDEARRRSQEQHTVCLGWETIRRVAAEGAVYFAEQDVALIAADDLFHADVRIQDAQRSGT